MMNGRLMQPQRGNPGASGPGGAFYMYLGMPESVRRGQQQTATDSYMRSKSVMGTSDSARIPQATDPYAGLHTKLPKSPMRLAPLSPQKAAPAPAPAAVVDGRPSLLAGSPPPAADAETNDAFSKLSKFKEMLDMGLITQEDYARNKQAVLGGLITDSSPPTVSERAVQRPRPVVRARPALPARSSPRFSIACVTSVARDACDEFPLGMLQHDEHVRTTNCLLPLLRFLALQIRKAAPHTQRWGQEVPVSTGEMSPESPPGPSPIAPSPKLPGINDHKSPKGKTRKKRQLGNDDDIPRIRNISVEKATRLIREKIEGRLEGGPAGLRRAFQYFDADGSGSIDREEMARAMRLKLQLVFDDSMMDKLMDRFDMQGTGLITYQSFCEMVMGSNSSDSTSFVAGAEWVNPKILLRMVRESAKDLRISFTHKDPRRTGKISINELRAVLSRFNIYLSDLQFKELMDDVGLESSGQIDYMLFLKHFRMQEINDVEKSCVGTISGMSKRKAIQLIRETIERRLEGGPAGLRRAFQFFDEDGGGTISHDEFKKALRLKTMLIFEDGLIDQVMAEYDPEGSGEITYNQFCEMVMGSKARDATGMSNSGARGVEKFESMLARKVRECAKSLRTYCQHCDAMGTGTVTDEELLHALQRHDIVMSDKQFSDMLAATGALDPGGIIRWSDWLAYFRKKEIQTTNSEMLGKITGGHGMSAQKAIQLIRDKITRRMKGGPAGLRRAYQEFCDDGSGVITYEMFRRVLAHKLMIDLDDELWDEVMLKFDTGRCAEPSLNSAPLQLPFRSASETANCASFPRSPRECSSCFRLRTCAYHSSAVPPVVASHSPLRVSCAAGSSTTPPSVSS